MIARSVVAAVVAFVVVVVLVVAAVLGFGLLQQSLSPASNVTSNASVNAMTNTTTTTATPSRTPTPTPSGQQIAVTQGQTFTISLSANPSTGYQWRASFDTGTLSLQNETFVSNPTSTLLVGVGGTDLFTFQALRVGTTSVTFDYVSPGGQTTQSASYSVIIH